MTKEQQEWLRQNTDFEPIGPPRFNIAFVETGTLDTNGVYTPSKPLQPVKLTLGCIGVGKRVKL